MNQELNLRPRQLIYNWMEFLKKMSPYLIHGVNAEAHKEKSSNREFELQFVCHTRVR